MTDKEFEQLSLEEKQAYFEDAVELYNNGFVEEDYVLRSLASVRFEEAVEKAGLVPEAFNDAQKKVIYEAAHERLNLSHLMHPRFSAAHMKFILEQELAGKDASWLPVGKLHVNIVVKPLTKAEINDIRKRMQEAESRDSVLADLEEKKKNANREERADMARKSRYMTYTKLLMQEYGTKQKTPKKGSVVSKIKQKKK